MLRGHATARVDDKGRLKIPAEFLDPFIGLCGTDRRTFVTSLDGQMVLVYPLPVWEVHEAKLAAMPSTSPLVVKYLRTASYWGKETSIDVAGRILIHPLLRQKARIGGETSVFGRQRILELCDHELYRGQPPIMSPEELAQLSGLER
jgi:MraZ protein